MAKVGNSDALSGIVGVTSGLNVFERPPTPVAIKGTRDVVIRPTQTVTRDGPIPFEIRGRPGTYIDLDKVRLRVKVKILKNDNTTIVPAGDRVGFVNNPLDSLFKQVEVIIGKATVTTADMNYPYKKYLRYLLTESPDAQDSLLHPRLWHRDKGGNMEVAAANTGLAARLSRGHEIELFGPLDFGVFDQDRMLVDNVDVLFSFLPSSDAFVLMKGDAATEGHLLITSMELIVREVALDDAVAEAMTGVMKSGLPALYPFTETKIIEIPIDNGLTEITKIIEHSQGLLPQRVMFGFVDTTAHQGTAITNPFNFKNFDIRSFKLTVNGRVLPENEGLKLHFGNGTVAAGYTTLMEATGKYDQGAPLAIKMSEYGAGYTLFAFDLTESGVGPFTYHKKQGGIELKVNFGTALPNAVTLLCYMETQKTLIVDALREGKVV